MEMSECFNLSDFNTDLLDTANWYRYSKKVCRFNETRIYNWYLQNTLHHSQKLEFFRSFKSDHTTSNYLDLTRGTAKPKEIGKITNK